MRSSIERDYNATKFPQWPVTGSAYDMVIIPDAQKMTVRRISLFILLFHFGYQCNIKKDEHIEGNWYWSSIHDLYSGFHDQSSNFP